MEDRSHYHERVKSGSRLGVWKVLLNATFREPLSSSFEVNPPVKGRPWWNWDLLHGHQDIIIMMMILNVQWIFFYYNESLPHLSFARTACALGHLRRYSLLVFITLVFLYILYILLVSCITISGAAVTQRLGCWVTDQKVRGPSSSNTKLPLLDL